MMRDEIERLRRAMRKENVQATIIPTSDFHGSEQIAARFMLRKYLSGFTGSAGTLVVTLDEAALWTDGRYFLQAGIELSGSGIELMKIGEKSTPTIEKYLLEKMPENSALGFDGRTFSFDYVNRLKQTLHAKNISFFDDIDFGSYVWEDRPGFPTEPVFELGEQFCGEPRAEKIARIREKMNEENADCLVVSSLDEIAWTLNLRANHADFSFCFYGFMLIFRDKSDTILFADKIIFSPEILGQLEADGIELHGYAQIYDELKAIRGKVWIDKKSSNYLLVSSVDNENIIDKPSPIELMKAVKNPTEILCERNAHLRDGVAVTRFMRWLKTEVSQEKITEISAAEKLEEFRRSSDRYLIPSFAPIIAYGKHGAVVHYSATEATNAVIEPHVLLLSDTGGHYIDGTTDVTRTFVLGEITDEEKRAFTLVLAGHLNLLLAKFPEGIRGSALDYAAR